jgi:hypothetical protein
LDTSAQYTTDAWIERIVIVGYPTNPTRITIDSGYLFSLIARTSISYDHRTFSGNKQATPIHNYQETSQTLLIRRPGPLVAADWKLTIA